VTGGAGFIGSNFIRYLFEQKDFKGKVINFDALTYAGNPENLQDIAAQYKERYQLVQGDITDTVAVKKTFKEHQPELIVHFAAESHVDRSIHGPEAFIRTNVMGTFYLLEAAKEIWAGREDVLFHHVSTDEVYGSLGETGQFFETTPYDPRSPYSASKASSDHLVRSFIHTYHFPATISNCSNNYGPYHFPEKLIPLMIENMLAGKPLPVYGDGQNIRDWLYVVDHAEAIWKIVSHSPIGETWNVGGGNEWTNLKLVHELCDKMAEATKLPKDHFKKLITFVKDRPGHDRRYAINFDKINKALGWKPRHAFDEGLKSTIAWVLENRAWVERVKSGAYREWMNTQYGK
jgi:dTDP-glucose 4,6-dehydratase